jgi:transposase InsO family protein
MKKDVQQERQWAVERFYLGERPHSICVSLDHSRSWLYKWIDRAASDDPVWYQDKSRRPHNPGRCTPAEKEELVKLVRLNLYNNDVFCGAQAIQWELQDLGVSPLPSLRTINRILSRNDLTNRRTGRYQPKGKAYPVLLAEHPNQIHQSDFVGPCYLKGPIRFYSLNMVDLCTGRCGIEPLYSRSGQAVIDGFWAAWKRIGIPTHLQVDNEMSFYGSPTHPRGMGPLIRLCLQHNIQLWFIPMQEPWRNGVVEKFNDHYEHKFLRKTTITSKPELLQKSHDFEYRHNSQYRYSKLGGKTPLATLAVMSKKNCASLDKNRRQTIHWKNQRPDSTMWFDLSAVT